MKKQYGFLLSALFFLIIGCSFLFVSCNNSDPNVTNTSTSTKSIPISTPSIISTLPHDTSYFTEGLEFYGNSLLESTGLPGKSRLIEYDPSTSKIAKQIKLEDSYFGEGITVLHDTLYQLTWQQHVAFLYDAKTFKKIKELPFKADGWGLTNDGKYLIASSGASSLFYYEPRTLKLVKEVKVSENGSAVPNINELEYVDGYVYANQWQYDYIVKIDPSTGNVISKLDLAGVTEAVKKIDPNVDYLNGIAYNHATKKFYVTGKNWPQMFEIQF